MADNLSPVLRAESNRAEVVAAVQQLTEEVRSLRAEIAAALVLVSSADLPGYAKRLESLERDIKGVRSKIDIHLRSDHGLASVNAGRPRP